MGESTSGRDLVPGSAEWLERKASCRHKWVLILPITGLLLTELVCQVCDTDNDELWYGGLCHYITMDLGNGVEIREGVHNSRTELQIPVNVFVRESVRWDSFLGKAVPEKEVRIEPQPEWVLPAEATQLTVLEGQFSSEPDSVA